jgi:ribosomal protein S27E
MAKKQPHEVLGFFIKVKCPVTGKEVDIKLSEYDISSTSQECEICGSHGDVTVNFKCTECNETHEHEIRSW